MNNPNISLQNYSAAIDIYKTQEMLNHWGSLAGKTLHCKVMRGVSFANHGGTSYPLPSELKQGDVIEIKVNKLFYEDFYEAEIKVGNVKREKLSLAQMGSHHYSRLSFRAFN